MELKFGVLIQGLRCITPKPNPSHEGPILLYSKPELLYHCKASPEGSLPWDLRCLDAGYTSRLYGLLVNSACRGGGLRFWALGFRIRIQGLLVEVLGRNQLSGLLA